MRASSLLNVVYPVLLLFLVGLGVLAIFEEDWLVVGIYAAGIVLSLLLPRLILPKKPSAPGRHKAVKHKKEKKKGFWSRLFRHHEKAKKKGFFSRLFKRRHHKKKEREGFWKRLFKKKPHKETKEEVKKEKPKVEAHHEKKIGFFQRLFKKKKVLKVYQGKEEKAPQIVEERGEKRIELVEINKPVVRKGTSIRTVKTDFDQLIELVEKKGKISLSEAAKALNHPKDQIEAWAKMLEEHGLLILEYPTFGEVKLKAVNKNG